MAKKQTGPKVTADVSGGGQTGVPPKAALPADQPAASPEGASPAGGLQGPAGGAAVPKEKELTPYEAMQAKRCKGSPEAKRVETDVEAEKLRRNTVVELPANRRVQLSRDITSGRVIPTDAEIKMAGLTKADVPKADVPVTGE